jgi:hypothetical protein
MTRADFIARYKVVAAAAAVSAAVHAAVFVGMPPRIEAFDEGKREIYTARLDPAAAMVSAGLAPAAAPPRAAKPRPRRAAPVLAPIDQDGEPELLAGDGVAVAGASPRVDEKPAEPPPEEPRPEVVALAQPAAPIPALEAPRFPVAALPGNISITYALTSPIANARAVYSWAREGDSYTISGEAEAIGFFTLFVEGRLLQESRGTITAEGLRPARFTERKPNGAPEGLEFDWAGRKVTFDRGDSRKTEDLTENTLDWLSMIFQMAHMPPSGDSYNLKVFTQRRYYNFSLKVLGIEEIEIPLGKLRALHLRHTDPEDQSQVDVWLGVDQHYLPVKLRYPVARNRMMVEQSATDVSER